MSFQIDPVEDPYINAVTLIVFQYKGAQPGERISKAQAMTYRRRLGLLGRHGRGDGARSECGFAACGVRPSTRWRRTRPGEALQPLAWMVPTQQSAAPYWPLFKGALQAQDTPVCRF